VWFLLLSGVAVLLVWNVVTARSAARRPGLALGTVSTITLSTLIAAVAHALGILVSQSPIAFGFFIDRPCLAATAP